MNTGRWESVKDLLYQALQLQPEQREKFLDEACSSDGLLRAELDSLLAADEEIRSSFMQAPPLANELMGEAAAGSTVEPGQTVARKFQLIRKLGEGGMGQVWLAEQASPVRRLVALKLIKAGMYDETVVQRFQAEQQSIAIMDHPAIAKVFDAGATEQGQPYFVMEYVPGLPITDYCDQKKLPIKRRLELFIQTCEGVQHAHQKAIIHRDLKPANILVVEVDGKPVPRIIDFGLAKATTPRIAGESLHTQLGGFVGTPGYMSPEQADPSEPDIDTRTDVYSLGVVLYVLLTGMPPLDMKQWQKQPFVDVLRKLREEEPARPSTKVSTSRDRSTATAESRSTQPAELVSLLRGDLDWITMKALEKDRARRYGTPSELAADVRRYLNHEAITARPASTGYRLRKYVRRHRVGVTVGAALLLLLAGFAGLQTVQVHRITRERDRANRERDRANRVTGFMTDMFTVADPSEARGNTITAREVLDKASQEIDVGLAKDPELQAQMMYTMGRVYDALGLYSKAESLFTRAVDIRVRILGPEHPDTLEAQALLGWEISRRGRYAEAEKLLRQALGDSRRVLGPSDVTIGLLFHLSSTLSEEGQFPEAEKLARESLEMSRSVKGPEHRQTIRVMYNLCAILGDEGRYAESEKLNREVLDLSRRVTGPESQETMAAMTALGDTLSDQGHYAEAETMTEETLALSRRVNGPDHPRTAALIYNLACLAALRGMPDRSLSLLREAIAHGLRVKSLSDMDKDSDLKSLHGNPQFEKIVVEARQRAIAQGKPN